MVVFDSSLTASLPFSSVFTAAELEMLGPAFNLGAEGRALTVVAARPLVFVPPSRIYRQVLARVYWSFRVSHLNITSDDPSHRLSHLRSLLVINLPHLSRRRTKQIRILTSLSKIERYEEKKLGALELGRGSDYTHALKSLSHTSP